MEPAYYELQLPRERLFAVSYIHNIMNYRYHWHADEFELNILLHGCQEYCYGTEIVLLHEDDILLIEPGIGHASFSQQADTRALVIRFSDAFFRPFAKRGYTYHFPGCRPSDTDCHAMRYARLRFYASQIYCALRQGGPFGNLRARAGLDFLIAALCEDFDPIRTRALPEKDIEQQKMFRTLLAYIEQNYAEKLTLDDMADLSQYNRTYLSTLFKTTIGINFHEYLTRVRFQHALLDLANSSKNLTQIAIENGFSDLKSMNTYFREILHRTPAEYRAQLSSDRIFVGADRDIVSAQDPLSRKKLNEYLRSPVFEL